MRLASMPLCHPDTHPGFARVSDTISSRIRLRVIVRPSEKLNRRADQKTFETQFVKQLIDARQYVSIRYVPTVLRQQVFYAGKRCGGNVQCIESSGFWHK